MKIICSWCKKVLGEKEPFDDPAVTHAKCSNCLEKQQREEQLANTTEAGKTITLDNGLKGFITIGGKETEKLGLGEILVAGKKFRCSKDERKKIEKHLNTLGEDDIDYTFLHSSVLDISHAVARRRKKNEVQPIPKEDVDYNCTVRLSKSAVLSSFDATATHFEETLNSFAELAVDSYMNNQARIQKDTVAAKEHWSSVYSKKDADQVSWFKPHLESSLSLIQETGLKGGSVIDVGGGASTLVDDLMGRGFKVTVLDISPEAIEVSKRRLGKAASKVEWIEGDIRLAKLPPQSFDIWHDRALLHFLTEPGDRISYGSALRGALKPGGYAIIATFGLKGPDKCSGLNIVRYNASQLLKELGQEFELVKQLKEDHLTPGGTVQSFAYFCLRRIPGKAEGR